MKKLTKAYAKKEAKETKAQEKKEPKAFQAKERKAGLEQPIVKKSLTPKPVAKKKVVGKKGLI